MARFVRYKHSNGLTTRNRPRRQRRPGGQHPLWLTQLQCRVDLAVRQRNYSSGDCMSRPSAQIVIRPPTADQNIFIFDLVAIDGPRRGQRLADHEVVGVLGQRGVRLQPEPAHEANVRFQLRRYGERNGYTIVE